MTRAKKKATAPATFLDLAVEYVDPTTIKVDPKNPRVIMPANRARLRHILKTFGLVEPFILRAEDGELIGGHQRLALAIEEGYTRVPIVRRAGLSKAQARALAVALNNPKAQGQYVEEDLRAVLGELDDEGILDDSGFDTEDLQAMFLEDEPEVTDHPIPQAPQMAFWLIAVPLEQAIEVSDAIEQLRDRPDVDVWATVADHKGTAPPKAAKPKRAKAS